MDEQNFVEYACADRIATITLNRPDKLNAVSDEVVAQLADALRRFDLDEEAEVAILNGKGRAFSSGADVRQRQLRSREEFEKLGGPQGWGTNSADLLTRAVNWKPVIAAVHGYVLGLALGLTLECDLIVAAEGTRFQLTETSRGLGASRYWALFQYRAAGGVRRRDRADRPLFHRRGRVQGRAVQPAGARGQASRGGARTGVAGGEKPAAGGAHDGADAALVHAAADARGAVHRRAVQALPDRGFPRSALAFSRKAPAQAGRASRRARDHALVERVRERHANLPLAGVVVLDFGQVYQGPYATMLMAKGRRRRDQDRAAATASRCAAAPRRARARPSRSRC